MPNLNQVNNLNGDASKPREGEAEQNAEPPAGDQQFEGGEKEDGADDGGEEDPVDNQTKPSTT